MTTEDVALYMCSKITLKNERVVVFDPSCGEGELLISAYKHLTENGVKPCNIELIGFDIDLEMVNIATGRLSEQCICNYTILHCDTTLVLSGDILHDRERSVLKDVNLIIGNPPYGKDLEVKFFQDCDNFFKDSQLIFLMPMSFADRAVNINYEILKGRPLGVTTGHIIVDHVCGSKYEVRKKKIKLTSVSNFEVLTGVKLYAKGEGIPPQSQDVVKEKPFSSNEKIDGWLPCLRTGDISKNSYNTGRLYVNYGQHLAHPKTIDRFTGPKIFIRRVPIWSCKTLGAAYSDETCLCAGDVLIIKHKNDDKQLLKGLCNYLNSHKAAEKIIELRPTVGHRDSFPKISAKDLVLLLKENIPSEHELISMSKNDE
ncbi:TPA: N-6 DNA methylase [Vibrio parahaemolyticus]|nr:N-6 DNA methylase [Vibrio alginolyticus]HCH0772055.1 N-6 DNA methylase [Vibrio parahaemolyticus]HCM1289697.1 N-6 DNA methylase [Vibrio parahaemolyticus]